MSTALEQFFITGFNKGLVSNKKPFLIPEQAWQVIENAYCFRDRMLKREGLELIGRLRRVLTAQSLGSTSAGVTTITISDVLSSFRATQPNAEIQPGSLVISIAAPDTATFTDNGDGTFAVTGAGVAAGSYVRYAVNTAGTITSLVVLKLTSATGGAAISANYSYFPSLPVMGISTQDQSGINAEQSIFFDQRYAYIYNAGAFQEYLPASTKTWASTNSDFFLAYNYRGTAANTRLLFETNFVNDASNPMRYTDGSTWTDFKPAVDGTNFILTARIIVAYYGRLLLLNTYEGANNAGAVNYYARCRFSQLGSPVDALAFRSDQFGRGGFLDAPTTEMIVGAEFVKNTLIVSFEKSKWQLRYVGEYGLPFVWERISIDFGSDSTFSTVSFDNTVLDIGDKAFTSTNSIECKRTDLELPDQIFSIQNENNGPQRVFGIRDYFKELVFWNYPDTLTTSVPGTALTFPNKVFVYNYRNGSWGIFRDSITAFGYLSYTTTSSPNVTWDDLTITWDDENVGWDDLDQQNPNFQFVVSGNQDGYVHVYASKTPDDPSLTVQGVDVSTTPVRLYIPNHNLTDGEIIYLTDLLFLDNATFQPVVSNLNDAFFRVTVITANTIDLSQWNTTTKSYAIDFTLTFTQGISVVPAANVLYAGGGSATLFPKMNLISKDINIYQKKGITTKLSAIDFLMQPSNDSGMTVRLWVNAANYISGGNVTTGNTGVSTVLQSGFYPPGSDYAWFRFYATLSAQYFNINITYDDDYMNTLTTHQTQWTLYAINAFVKPGGRIIF